MKKLNAALMVAGMMMVFPAYAQDAAEVASAQLAETMTSGEMLNAATNGVGKVEQVISKGQTMLEEARKESDVMRMDCLNAQLVNARGFYNVVQNGESNLRDAVNRNDKAAQEHHYRLVQLAVSKTETISARMSECSNGKVGNITGTHSETTRYCKIEPCLGGEKYYDPENPLEDEQHKLTDPFVADASPYM